MPRTGGSESIRETQLVLISVCPFHSRPTSVCSTSLADNFLLSETMPREDRRQSGLASRTVAQPRSLPGYLITSPSFLRTFLQRRSSGEPVVSVFTLSLGPDLSVSRIFGEPTDRRVHSPGRSHSVVTSLFTRTSTGVCPSKLFPVYHPPGLFPRHDR